MSCVICTVTTKDYLFHFEPFIKSFNLLEIKKDIVFLIECIDFEEFDKQYIKSILISYKLLDKVNFIYSVSGTKTIEEKRGYATNRRAFLLCEAISYESDLIIYSDINTLFLKGVDDLINNSTSKTTIIFDENNIFLKEIKKNHKNIFKLAKKRKYKKYVGPMGTILKGICLAGFQFYRVDEEVKKMLNDYVSIVSKNKYSWFGDQEALAFLCLKYIRKISFNLVSDDFIGLTNFFPNNIFCIISKNGRDKLYKECSSYILDLDCKANLLTYKPIFKNSILKRLFLKLFIDKDISPKFFEIKKLIFQKFKNIIFNNFKENFGMDIDKFTNNGKIFFTPYYISSFGLIKGCRDLYKVDLYFLNINIIYIPFDIYYSNTLEINKYLIFNID